MSSFLGPGTLTRISIADNDGRFLEFESTISVTHSATAQLTDHPVESDDQGNIDITDHIKADPETVSINGIVSNFPIVLLASINKEPSVPGGDPETRVSDAYDFLNGIKESGKLVTVSTKLRDYSNMAIVGLSVTQDKDTSEILDVSVDLRSLRTATTQTVDAPEPEQKPRKKINKRGKKPKTPSTPAVESRGDSLLLRLFNSFTGAG